MNIDDDDIIDFKLRIELLSSMLDDLYDEVPINKPLINYYENLLDDIVICFVSS